MAYTAPTTELEAVNAMLASIGQAPVSTLAVTGILDVTDARSALERVTKRTLGHKWNFNTDEGVTLSPDSDGVVLIPAGALEVDAVSPTTNLVQRRHPTKNAMALWNKDERTWTFTAPVEVNVVWAFPFSDLPEVARDYIQISAGRLFQSQKVGSQILRAFEAEDEQRAWVDLMRAEGRSRDTNLFRRNPLLQNLLNRNF